MSETGEGTPPPSVIRRTFEGLFNRTKEKLTPQKGELYYVHWKEYRGKSEFSELVKEGHVLGLVNGKSKKDPGVIELIPILGTKKMGRERGRVVLNYDLIVTENVPLSFFTVGWEAANDDGSGFMETHYHRIPRDSLNEFRTVLAEIADDCTHEGAGEIITFLEEKAANRYPKITAYLKEKLSSPR